MLVVARRGGAPAKVLETRDLNALAGGADSAVVRAT
jgi:hypothetical protein